MGSRSLFLLITLFLGIEGVLVFAADRAFSWAGGWVKGVVGYWTLVLVCIYRFEVLWLLLPRIQRIGEAPVAKLLRFPFIVPVCVSAQFLLCNGRQRCPLRGQALTLVT